mgnify:CR=1 FL=1
MNKEADRFLSQLHPSICTCVWTRSQPLAKMKELMEKLVKHRKWVNIEIKTKSHAKVLEQCVYLEVLFGHNFPSSVWHYRASHILFVNNFYFTWLTTVDMTASISTLKLHVSLYLMPEDTYRVHSLQSYSWWNTSACDSSCIGRRKVVKLFAQLYHMFKSHV